MAQPSTTIPLADLVRLPDVPWTVERDGVRAWLMIAVGSLVLAGLLASTLVIGRVPGLSALFGDPGLFRRCLVVHVDLSIVVWFYAFAGALYCTLPSRRPSPRLARAGVGLAIGGVLMLLAGAGARGAAPVLANYVPVVEHPVFLGGLVCFAAGLAVTVLRPALSPALELRHGPIALPEAARPALRAVAIAILLALMTFGAAWLVTPTNLSPEGYWEVVMWGGGHVLQFASVAAMLAVWITLTVSIAGESPLSRRASGALFGLFVAPLFVAPLLALRGTGDGTYLRGFTRLMELGIFPVVTVVLVACARTLVRARRAGRARLGDPRLVGLVTSAVLTVVGFCLGAIIDGSNTVIPAHYHASIGAVTVAFMTVTYVLLAPLGMRIEGRRRRWLAAWQPLVFGVGQTMFAAGFAIAGAHGMMRKTYAAQQHIQSSGQELGMLVMGIGGLIAVAGGVLYLWLVVGAWRRRQRGQ